MNVESTEIVWLTGKEAKQAIRDYVKAKGFKVPGYAQITGLGEISEAKNAISVQVSRSTHEVKS